MADPHIVTDPRTRGRCSGDRRAGHRQVHACLSTRRPRRSPRASTRNRCLLLCSSAQAAARARAALSVALRGRGQSPVVRQPLVRTVHSYAFAVLRLAAQRNGGPPPRLVTGAEQDGIIRELLAGDLAEDRTPW